MNRGGGYFGQQPAQVDTNTGAGGGDFGVNAMLRGFSGGRNVPSEIMETGHSTLHDIRATAIAVKDLRDQLRVPIQETGDIIHETKLKWPTMMTNADTTIKEIQQTAGTIRSTVKPVVFLIVVALILSIVALIIYVGGKFWAWKQARDMNNYNSNLLGNSSSVGGANDNNNNSLYRGSLLTMPTRNSRGIFNTTNN
jgi:hypothetical protein